MARPSFKTLDYLYFHTSGAGNTGHATIVTSNRTYVMALAAATANSFQFTSGASISRIILSTKCAAAGGIEISRVSTSQFANSGLATSDVLGRLEIEAVTTSGLANESLVIEYA